MIMDLMNGGELKDKYRKYADKVVMFNVIML